MTQTGLISIPTLRRVAQADATPIRGDAMLALVEAVEAAQASHNWTMGRSPESLGDAKRRLDAALARFDLGEET